MQNEIEQAQLEAEQHLQFGTTAEVELTELQEHTSKVLEEVRKRNEWLRQMPSRKEAYSYLGRIVGEMNIAIQYREQVINSVLNDMYAYGKLQGLMDDPYVSDIQVYGGHGTFYKTIKFEDRRESTEGFMTHEELVSFITRKLAGTNYRFDLSTPSLDAILPDGSRLHVRVGASGWTVEDQEGRRLTQDCIIATIRKPLYPFTLEELQATGSFSPEVLTYLYWVQRLGDGFVIGGDVGSGKSALMAAMMGKNPRGQMDVLMEEMPEVQALNERCARLYTRPANAEGKGAITMYENARDILRMFFDNAYIGEVREEEISWCFLQCGLTVTRQTGTTTHAVKGVDTVIQRICTLAMGAGTRPSARVVGQMFCTSVRQVIVMHKTSVGKRMTEIGYVLDYDVERNAVPYITVMRWDEETDSFDFLGVPEEMARRAKNMITLQVQENPEIRYVHLG